MNLPVRNLRVFVANVDWEAPVAERTEAAVRKTLGERDPEVRGTPFVLAFSTPPFSGYGAVQDMARGIDRALRDFAGRGSSGGLGFRAKRRASGRRHAVGEVEHAVHRRGEFVRAGFYRHRRSGAESEGFVPVVIKSLGLRRVSE